MAEEPSVQYRIFSIPVPGGGIEIPVGVRPLEGDDVARIDFPIVTGDVLNQWYATPPRITGGPHHLGAIPFKYTTELEGSVFATTDRAADREWFLRPANEKDTYSIGIDERNESVWTVVNGRVKIEPFEAGNWNQVFRIVLRVGE